MMNHDEMIAVIRAHKEGKQLQYREAVNLGELVEPWFDQPIGSVPSWNFARCDYRIKPEPPKPREWELGLNDSGIAMHAISCPEGAAQSRISGLRYVHVREVLPEAQ